MLTLWHGGGSWILLLSRCPLLLFGPFGPRLLNDADAKRAHVAVHILYITSCRLHPSTAHLFPQFPSSGFFPGFFPFMFSSHLLSLAVFLIEGFCCHYSRLCVCPRNTCCLNYIVALQNFRAC